MIGRRLRPLRRAALARTAARTAPPDTEPRVQGGLGQPEAVQLLGVLVRLAEALLSSGAPAADVTASTLAAARGGGLPACQVDVTYTSVTVSTVRDDGVPLTAVRIVRQRDPDYARLAHLYALAAAASVTRVDDLSARLAQVLGAGHAYRSTTARAATVVLAAALSVLLGGGWAVASAAAVASGLVLLVQDQARRRSLPPFFSQAAGAAAATAVALALLLVEPELPPAVGALTPSLVVGPGIVVLLAGLSLVESAEDAISGYYVTAGARAFETVLLTTGIVVGIAVALDLAQRAGVGLSLTDAGPPPRPMLLSTAAAAVTSSAWAVSQHAGRRAVVLGGAVGALGWLVALLTARAGLGPTGAAAAAALAVGFAARRLGPRLSSPPVVVTACGIVPLLPGLAVYRAIAAVVGGDAAGGLTRLVAAVGVGLALAAGTTLGTWLATPPRGRRAASRPGGAAVPGAA